MYLEHYNRLTKIERFKIYTNFEEFEIFELFDVDLMMKVVMNM
jgi:hypothetical protein